MKNKLTVVLALFSMFFMVPFAAQANTHEEYVKSLKEDMSKSGYIPLDQAVAKFEKMYNVKVKLPNVPINSSYEVGRINPKEDKLSLKWMDLSEGSSKSFRVDVRTIEENSTDLRYADEQKDELVTLQDGTKSYVKNSPDYYEVSFKKNSLEYLYRADSKDMKKQDCIDIAESFK
ncbi:hypothetical protein ICR95_26270 (plasmid) [Priestia megaterium]|uniref:hypothetical protein n=1 Tax=Priestia TaxID=2800373 RepID=UPI00196A7D22|nr:MULTISPECIES: hypothetical protein [Priestia]MCU7712927.1 hypothetical protein [Priestia megaterium]MCW1048853.1 hypothetical protein [Priestia sp. JV24]QSF36110.1 hypothetical protein ICR95_26270 [Priestia megaterium]